MTTSDTGVRRGRPTTSGDGVPAGARRRRRALSVTTSLALLSSAVLTSAAGFAALPAAAASGTPATQRSVTDHAAPAGRLAPSADPICSRTGGAASCDLYAAAGTTVLNSATVPVWSFTSTSTPDGPTSAVGPTIVVTKGDAVTLTIHNDLPSEAGPLALSVPSMPGLPTDMTGVATGGTKSYTFPASRAGTFLYQAGHTPNGQRQAQMGLVGALVVLDSATGTAYGNSYDDDAVMLLSEIDPAFAANPMAFDMRDYAPKYRLINGKSFPETDPIGTDQGRTVLLRYVNAGSYTHDMALLNTEQTVVAEDAHQLPVGAPEITPAITPGQSVDALVRIPGTDASPEARYTLFEDAQHLDSAGANVANSTGLGFGGMMTYLDTNLPPVTGDTVGPVVSHVAFSANPVSGGTVGVSADASDDQGTVDRIEYVVDDSTTAVCTGAAFASTSLPVTAGCDPTVHGTSGTVTGATATVDAGALAAGKHKVYVRAMDSAGNWGAITSAVLNVAKNGPLTTGVTVTPSNVNSGSVAVQATGDDSDAGGKITAAQALVDPPATLPDAADPAWTSLALNRSATVVSETGTFDVGQLSEGAHSVLVRSKNSLGVWGAGVTVALSVDRTGPASTIESIDTSPNNGTQGSSTDPDGVSVQATVNDPVVGGVSSPIVDAEGFLDTAGADGSGFPMVTVDGAFDNRPSVAVNGSFPLTEILPLKDGVHHVLVHGKDAAGNWGPTTSIDLVVDKTGPVASAVKGQQAAGASTLTLSATLTDPAPGSGIAAAEWFMDADPGPGKATPFATVPSGATGTVSAVVDLRAMKGGTHQFFVRALDAADNWGKAVPVSVSVVQPREIWSDSFDAPLAWTGGSVGNVTTVTPPSSVSGMTGKVLAATVRSGSPAYVVDTNPVTEPRYVASFKLNPGTLRTPTAGVTLFSGQTAAGGQLFTVQLRYTGGTAARQVRVSLTRSGGSALSSAWTTIPAGTSQVSLTWTNGLRSSLAVKVGAITVPTLTGIQLGTLDTVRLGPSAGVGTGSSGTVYVDAFSATRS